MISSFVSAGMGGADTALDAIDTVGHGVYNMASTEKDGLMTTADGFVHADVHETGQGLKKSTWGGVGNAAADAEFVPNCLVHLKNVGLIDVIDNTAIGKLGK